MSTYPETPRQKLFVGVSIFVALVSTSYRFLMYYPVYLLDVPYKVLRLQPDESESVTEEARLLPSRKIVLKMLMPRLNELAEDELKARGRYTREAKTLLHSEKVQRYARDSMAWYLADLPDEQITFFARHEKPKDKMTDKEREWLSDLSLRMVIIARTTEPLLQ